MTFIEEARAILSPEEMDILTALSVKSAAFETTAEEDKDLAGLKSKVHTAISDRDRLKSLEFLKSKSFSAFDVLKTANFTRQEVLKAVAQLFPSEVSEAISTYATGAYKEGERMSKELKKAIDDGGVQGFVSGLTPFGRTFLSKSKVAAKGANAGKDSYPALAAAARRVGLPYDDLKAALLA